MARPLREEFFVASLTLQSVGTLSEFVLLKFEYLRFTQ